MRRAEQELVEANERAVLLAVGALEGCELRHLPGATLLDSGVDIPAFNGVIATAAAPDGVPEVAEAAAAWFAARGRPWVWRAGAGNRPDDLPRRLETLGFTVDDAERGMVGDLREVTDGGGAGGAHAVEEVGDDEAAFVEWFGVFAPAFAIPPPLAQALAPVVLAAGRSGGPLRHFLLRDEHGAARACGSLAIGGGAVGLANIATPPPHRGRGLGRAMVTALLREARDLGCTTAVLSATPMATELYRSLGFTETGPRWIYVPPA